jgi:hypothetical protein
MGDWESHQQDHQKAISDQLRLDFETGYRLKQSQCATASGVETDAFALPTGFSVLVPLAELGDGQEGYSTHRDERKGWGGLGGPSFTKLVGDTMIDSIISGQHSLRRAGKYNGVPRMRPATPRRVSEQEDPGAVHFLFCWQRLQCNVHWNR